MDENRMDRGRDTPCMRRLHNRPDCQLSADGAAVFDNFNSPPQRDFNTEEMAGSMQYILAQNIGQFVVVEFLIGTEQMVRKQGVLYHVGRSYVTLYDESANNFIVCDVFSVKFVYFYMPGDRPRGNYNVLPGTNGEMGMNRRMR